MADWASESCHWYDAKTGEPRYRILGANGVERDTTLRDAKKHGWVPGYTTIARCAYKWQLEEWKLTQGIMAALTTERRDGETDEALVQRIKDDGREQAKKAAERGSEIHAAIEQSFRGEPVDMDLVPWVESIHNLLVQTFGERAAGYQAWRPEKSFAHPLGYGGKVDLHSDSVLIDFKGKEGDRSKWATYDEHAMQLAAYAQGLNPACNMMLSAAWPRCGIVFFDRVEPYSEFHEVKPPELERGWRMFEALLAYWKAANL